MDKTLETSRQADFGSQPQPVVLTADEVEQVAGGLNPQPLPPGREEMRD
jgi:hypothetical protein